jgi:hypothetical protein
MSLLSKFVFDPIKAALGRGATSSNPVVVAAAVAGQATYTAAANDVATAASQPLSANSAAALGSNLIKDAEDGLRLALVGIITAGLANVPIIGAAVTPEAVAAANMALAFAEQHALTYVSALFAHGKAQVPPVSQPAAAAQLAA